MGEEEELYLPHSPHLIEHIKIIHIPFLDIWLVLFSGQVTLGAIQVYMHQRVISPINDNDAELSRQFPFGIDLNKILPHLLKLRTKKSLRDNFHNIHK